MPDHAEALAHLRAADPVMKSLLDRFGEPEEVLRRRGRRPTEAYAALLRSIVGQQLSTKAARSIYNRLLEYFDGKDPTPAQILAADPEEMRAAAGLSRSKVSFLRDLAKHVEEGLLDLVHISELPDDDVVEQLTAVKGLGPWTVHMFLIFHLGRPDVLPTGDLGIRRATQIEYGMDELPTPAELTEIADPWRPHRSLACLYLWRSLDNAPD